MGPYVENVLPLQEGSTQWSSADLGSNERKQKFLRLMGAGKVSFLYCYDQFTFRPQHKNITALIDLHSHFEISREVLMTYIKLNCFGFPERTHWSPRHWGPQVDIPFPQR